LFQVQSILQEDWESISSTNHPDKREYIANCMVQSSVFLGSTVAFEGLFEKIRTQYIRRKLISCYQEQEKEMLNTAKFSDIEILADKGVQEVSHTLDETDKAEIMDFKASVLNTLNEKPEASISTGYQALDNIIDGFKAGKLITMAGGTGKGKSAFAVNIALNVAAQGYTVALWSFEMGVNEVNNRMIDIITGYSVRDWVNKEVRYNLARKYIDNTNDDIQVFTDKIRSLSNFYLTCRRLSRKQNMKVVIIDYLQLIRLSSHSGLNRTAELEYITNNLKNMASELGITIIILSQLSREHEKREDKTPRLSDLRDSGSIEQDSNIVMFIHQPEQPTDYIGRDERFMEIIIAKHREGRTGIIPMEFQGNISKFTSLKLER
jgi:replicative DNA helicase